MDHFGGFEPVVGSIRALRTFRIDADGVLYPVHSDEPWQPGTNTARCLAAGAGDGRHAVPDWDCTCGFYAYGAEVDTAEQPRARHLLAAVTVWGRVVAGTRGVRAEHARIEAVWASDRVVPDLLAKLAARYPGTVVYRDRSAFLQAHRPTRLDCYEQTPTRAALVPRGLAATVSVAALALGCLSARTITTHAYLLIASIAAAGILAARAAALYRRRACRDRAGALGSLAALMWLLSPFAGPAGLLMLRIPMIQVALLGGSLRARVGVAAADIPAVITPWQPPNPVT